jgi:hypothetical protein
LPEGEANPLAQYASLLTTNWQRCRKDINVLDATPQGHAACIEQMRSGVPYKL